MLFPSWAGGLLRRLSIFLIGTLVITFLLHVPQGLGPAKYSGGLPSFSVGRWVESSASYLGQLTLGQPGILRRLGPPGFREDQPVSRVLAVQSPRSLYLLGLALLFALSVGTLLGLAASRFGSWRFRGAALSVTLLMLSAPDVLLVAGLRRIAIWAMENLGIELLDPMSVGISWTDAFFPALALGALPVALVARTTAVAFDEVYIQLYIRTAVAKGLTAWQVIWRHALKNAWIRVADVGPLIVGSLVSGLVVVELLFYYPGIGRTLGLLLERGVQPQAATAITLVLMAAAMLIEWALSSVRVWLDPRLAGKAERWQLPSLSRWLARMRSRSPRQVAPKGAPAPGFTVREMVEESFSHLAWFLRPSRMLVELWRNPALLIGLLGVAGLFYLAIFGGSLADFRAVAVMPKHIVHEETVYFAPYQPGLPGFPLGSDIQGRDMLARILMGARYTIFFTLAVTPVRFLVALPWGLMAGMKGAGWATTSRTLSLVASAVPMVLIPAALFPLRGLLGGDPLSDSAFWLITLILAVGGVPRLVESIRMQVEAALVQPYLEGAHAVGARPGRILWRHVIPHLAPQLWVSAATDMAWTLLLLAQLGVFSIFVGGSTRETAYGETSLIGIPRVPDWSSMLARPYEVIYRAPWALWFPALAFLFAVSAFNLMAEGLRKRLQSFSATPALFDVESLPDGRQRMLRPVRRRLTLEWTAFALLLLLGSTGLNYLHRSVSAETLPPLDRSRVAAQMAVETIYGTGSMQERFEAVAHLEQTITAYMTDAHAAKLGPAQMQQDLHGRANLFAPAGGPLVLQVTMPNTVRHLVTESEHDHLFLQERESGLIYHHTGNMKPAYAGVLESGWLILTGTVPATTRFGISVWKREGDAWAPAPEKARALLQAVPAEFQPAWVEPNQITLGHGSAEVGERGPLTLCKPRRTDCVDIPWPK